MQKVELETSNKNLEGELNKLKTMKTQIETDLSEQKKLQEAVSFHRFYNLF